MKRRTAKKRASREKRWERWNIVHAAGCTYDNCASRYHTPDELAGLAQSGVRIPKSMRSTVRGTAPEMEQS